MPYKSALKMSATLQVIRFDKLGFLEKKVKYPQSSHG